MATDFAITNDAQTGPPQLTAHARLDRLTLPVGRGGWADAAAQIDHDADHPFGHSRTKARAGLSHQNPLMTCRCDVDGADVHRTPHGCQQTRHCGKKFGVECRLAVRDQNITALRSLDQLPG